MSEFAKEFKALRILKGFHSKDLAREVGKNPTYVSQIERDLIKNPAPKTLSKLMEVMQLNQLEKLSLLSKLSQNQILADGGIYTQDYCERIANWVFDEIQGYPFEVQKRLLQKIVNNL